MKGLKALMLLLFGGFLFFVTPKPVIAKQQTNGVSDYRVLRPPGNYLLATVPVVQEVVVIHNYMWVNNSPGLLQGTNDYNLLKCPKNTEYDIRNNFLMYKRARDGLRCNLASVKKQYRK